MRFYQTGIIILLWLFHMVQLGSAAKDHFLQGSPLTPNNRNDDTHASSAGPAEVAAGAATTLQRVRHSFLNKSSVQSFGSHAAIKRTGSGPDDPPDTGPGPDDHPDDPAKMNRTEEAFDDMIAKYGMTVEADKELHIQRGEVIKARDDYQDALKNLKAGHGTLVDAGHEVHQGIHDYNKDASQMINKKFDEEKKDRANKYETDVQTEVKKFEEEQKQAAKLEDEQNEAIQKQVDDGSEHLYVYTTGCRCLKNIPQNEKPTSSFLTAKDPPDEDAQSKQETPANETNDKGADEGGDEKGGNQTDEKGGDVKVDDLPPIVVQQPEYGEPYTEMCCASKEVGLPNLQLADAGTAASCIWGRCEKFFDDEADVEADGRPVKIKVADRALAPTNSAIWEAMKRALQKCECLEAFPDMKECTCYDEDKDSDGEPDGEICQKYNAEMLAAPDEEKCPQNIDTESECDAAKDYVEQKCRALNGQNPTWFFLDDDGNMIWEKEEDHAMQLRFTFEQKDQYNKLWTAQRKAWDECCEKDGSPNVDRLKVVVANCRGSSKCGEECAEHEVYNGENSKGIDIGSSCSDIFEHICDKAGTECLQICEENTCTTEHFVRFQKLGCLGSELTENEKYEISDWIKQNARGCEENLLEDGGSIQFAVNAKLRCKEKSECAGVLKDSSVLPPLFHLVGPAGVDKCETVDDSEETQLIVYLNPVFKDEEDLTPITVEEETEPPPVCAPNHNECGDGYGEDCCDVTDEFIYRAFDEVKMDTKRDKADSDRDPAGACTKTWTSCVDHKTNEEADESYAQYRMKPKKGGPPPPNAIALADNFGEYLCCCDKAISAPGMEPGKSPCRLVNKMMNHNMDPGYNMAKYAEEIHHDEAKWPLSFYFTSGDFGGSWYTCSRLKGPGWESYHTVGGPRAKEGKKCLVPSKDAKLLSDKTLYDITEFIEKTQLVDDDRHASALHKSGIVENAQKTEPWKTFDNPNFPPIHLSDKLNTYVLGKRVSSDYTQVWVNEYTCCCRQEKPTCHLVLLSRPGMSKYRGKHWEACNKLLGKWNGVYTYFDQYNSADYGTEGGLMDSEVYKRQKPMPALDGEGNTIKPLQWVLKNEFIGEITKGNSGADQERQGSDIDVVVHFYGMGKKSMSSDPVERQCIVTEDDARDVGFPMRKVDGRGKPMETEEEYHERIENEAKTWEKWSDTCEEEGLPMPPCGLKQFNEERRERMMEALGMNP